METTYMTTAEVAELFKVKPLTVRRWRQAKSGPPYLKLGHATIRYERAKVLEWAERDRSRAAGEPS